MSYSKALALLKAYRPKALGRYSLFSARSGQCCALGAMLLQYRGNPEAFTASVPRMKKEEETELMRFNDNQNCAPTERYKRVVAWMRERVAEESE